MALQIEIITLRSHGQGEEAEAVIRMMQGIGENAHTEQRRLFVSSSMLFEIGNISAERLPYPLTLEQFDTLENRANLWEAVKKGIELLSYHDQTRTALISKLCQRGFRRELSEEAVEYLTEIGYINEEKMLARLVEQLANQKLYGPARIKLELQKKGISSEILREALPELLAEIDFDANLSRCIAKKCDVSRLDDRSYRESMCAAFYRLGYTPSETRSAMKKIQENEDE